MIVPWFVNWSGCKAGFEAEAEKILGQPVRVIGSVKATILPAPSLTFEDVWIGDGEPMLKVARFSATIEMMPLLQGKLHIVSMVFDRPHMRIVVDELGRFNWRSGGETSNGLALEDTVFEGVEIVDGRIDYIDRLGGNEFSFEGIEATANASSLIGPWRIDGTYKEDEKKIAFGIATGRRLENGRIRVKTESSPAAWNVDLATDGVLGRSEDGLFYDGTYSIAEIVPELSVGVDGKVSSADNPIGWRSEGKFNLTRQRLAVTKSVLMDGPPARPYSIAGSLIVEFGEKPRFEARGTARQIDLDRSLGNRLGETVAVAEARKSVVEWLADSFVPPIPGSIFFSVPGIVVGGSVIEDVSFEARKTVGGWRLARFNARLPGQGTFSANGVLATESEVSFAGDFRLAVARPAGFAKWWRGAGNDAPVRLPPFEIEGRAELDEQRFNLDQIEALIGDAAIKGRIAWSENDERHYRRILEVALAANSVDFAQTRALVELAAGGELTGSRLSADLYAIKFDADLFWLDDLAIRDVAIDASLADDALIVKEFAIADLGGARLDVTEGRIDDLTSSPTGALEAQLDGDSLFGVTRVVQSLLPNHPFSDWLTNRAPSMSPAFVNATIEAPALDRDADFHIRVGAQAAETTLSARFDLSGSLAGWRQSNTRAEIQVKSSDAAELARQSGIMTRKAAAAGSAEFNIITNGVPAEGMESDITGNFAGVGVRSNGEITIGADLVPAFSGLLNAQTDDLDAITRFAAIDIPGLVPGASARIGGEIEANAETVGMVLKNSHVAGRRFVGAVSLGNADDASWRIDGDLRVEAIDLGWLTALGLGFPLEPTGEASAPWSRTLFREPGFGSIKGSVALAADRLAIAEDLDAQQAKLELEFLPGRLSIDIADAEFGGGNMSGDFEIFNVGGDASMSGRLTVNDAALAPLVWRRDGEAVASGRLDLSAELTAAGDSPAGLVSSLTGAGRIVVRNGTARFINPLALAPLIEASDVDKEFSEEELLDALTDEIDAGSLVFSDVEGAFTIAGSVARLASLVVDSETTLALGDVDIDLGNMNIASDWTVAFGLGEGEEEGSPPQIGIGFHGPLDDPARTIDVVPFSSYLSIRQEKRLLELLKQTEANRAENERIRREQRRRREDTERRAKEAALGNAARIVRREPEPSSDIEALIEEVREATEAGPPDAIESNTVESLSSPRSIAVEAASQAVEAAEQSANSTLPDVPLPPARPLDLRPLLPLNSGVPVPPAPIPAQ